MKTLPKGGVHELFALVLSVEKGAGSLELPGAPFYHKDMRAYIVRR